MEKLRRHLANISYVSDEYLPFQRVLEIKPDKSFIKRIEPHHREAPYGKVWLTGSGPLSYEHVENSYFLFHYVQTTLPPWVKEYKTIVSGLEIDKINYSITRTANCLGSVYGLITMAEAFGIEHDLNRIKKAYENTLRKTDYVSWWDMTREEIEEAAQLYERLRKNLEKKVKEGLRRG